MAYVLEGYTGAALRACGVRVRPLGNRFRRVDSAAAADHHEQVWGVYRRYLDGRVPRQACEVGPGDSLGMAVLLESAGAHQVTLVDRFPIRPREADEETCALLARRHGVARRATRRLASGETAETFFGRAQAAFDFIGSNAVLEHLDRPIETLSRMDEALAPGGVMVHVVDLRPHGLFAGLGPLAWLETPAWVHRLITRPTARPNRVLFHQYRAWAQARGDRARCYVRHLAGREDFVGDVPEAELPEDAMRAATRLVEAQRERLVPELRDVPAADLAITAFVLVVEKPVVA